jgi:hypothetical protein
VRRCLSRRSAISSLEGDRGLAGHRLEKTTVLTRVRLFRETRTKGDETDEPAVPAGQRHQALGLERTEGLEGPGLQHVLLGAVGARLAAGEHLGGIEIAREPEGLGSAKSVEPSVGSFQVDGQRAWQQRRADLLLQQARDLLTAARRPDPGRELLEHAVDVIGPAEEGPVDALAHASVESRRAPGQQCPEARTQGEPDCGRALRGAGRELHRARHEKGRAQGEDHQDPDRPALDEEVAGAAPKEDRHLEHAVLDHGVAVRQRQHGHGQHHRGPDPEAQGRRGPAENHRRHLEGQGRHQGEERPPDDDATLPPGLGIG